MATTRSPGPSRSSSRWSLGAFPDGRSGRMTSGAGGSVDGSPGGGGTRTVGIIGWPVEHSLSPPIHNAAFRTLGVDWVYVPLPVAPGRLSEALRGLRALGFAGANVTMPHKQESAGGCATLSENARLTGAVNTIVVGPDGLAGHNTDVQGFTRFLAEDAGFDPAGRTGLLYGAGGAARACALSLARGGLRSLSVVARDPARADPLRDVVS